MISGAHVPRWAAHGDEDLVIDGTAALEKLPVKGSRREVERAGVDERMTA